MFNLWKYSCKANYPVCDAYVLFIAAIHQTVDSPRKVVETAMEKGAELVGAKGCYSPKEDGKLEYYGVITLPEVSEYNLDNPVLSFATGEY